MQTRLSRRDILKLSGLSLGALAARPLPPEDNILSFGLGRVTTDTIFVRKDPSRYSDRAGVRRRDSLVNLLEEVRNPQGGPKNPRWYRVIGGYIHSSAIQRVETIHNKPQLSIKNNWQLGEITVPFSQSMRYYRTTGWQPLYRLYYQSVHWITGVGEGPDGLPWYELTDDRLGVKYSIPARDMRLIPNEELTPISPEIPQEEKRIVVSLDDQTVTCFEKEEQVFFTDVSTGAGGATNNGIPRSTPPGKFRIAWKMPVRHMGEGDLTHEIDAYELPGVPWCSFFVSTGVAFHGTYWHDNYGTPMSSGCVNMRPDEAKWLFRWTMPSASPVDLYSEGPGTIVEVEDAS